MLVVGYWCGFVDFVCCCVWGCLGICLDSLVLVLLLFDDCLCFNCLIDCELWVWCLVCCCLGCLCVELCGLVDGLWRLVLLVCVILICVLAVFSVVGLVI